MSSCEIPNYNEPALALWYSLEQLEARGLHEHGMYTHVLWGVSEGLLIVDLGFRDVGRAMCVRENVYHLTATNRRKLYLG